MKRMANKFDDLKEVIKIFESSQFKSNAWEYESVKQLFWNFAFATKWLSNFIKESSDEDKYFIANSFCPI